MMDLWWLILLTALISAVVTGWIRRYALSSYAFMDHPNERSAHQIPTPRGGGVAIAVSFSLATLVLCAKGALPLNLSVALLGAGGSMALLGFWDDRQPLSARYRLVGHVLAAAWTLYWLDGLPALSFFGSTFDLGWFGELLAALCLVWLLNLYNFMDGLDGLASLEALSLCLGGILLYVVTQDSDQSVALWILGAAVSGFLIWNFPPARIFMGDAGSGFLGITLGVLMLQASHVQPQLFWGWLILLGVFVVDASLTLMRRLLQGEHVFQAHRRHAYQYAARRWAAHKPVVLVVSGINLVWLLPLALCVAANHLEGTTALVIAYSPLVGLALYLGAGKPEEQQTS